jgi:hypothetical protein
MRLNYLLLGTMALLLASLLALDMRARGKVYIALCFVPGYEIVLFY